MMKYIRYKIQKTPYKIGALRKSKMYSMKFY